MAQASKEEMAEPQQQHPEPPNTTNVADLSVRQLKAALAAAGVDSSHCLERRELELLLESSSGSVPTSTAAPGGSTANALSEVAARIGVDPLLLPERALAVHWAADSGGPPDGMLRLTVTQEWLQDTTPDNTGSACWPGSLLLSHFMLSAPTLDLLIQQSPELGSALGGAVGPHILELGCGGAALPGTCLLRRFPRAHLTFADRSASLLELATKNLQRNVKQHEPDSERQRWRFCELEWGGAALPASVADAAGRCALVICAELLYEAAVAPLLLRTLSLLLAPSPSRPLAQSSPG